MRGNKLMLAVLLGTASILAANGAGTGAKLRQASDLSAQFAFQSNQHSVNENANEFAIVVSRVGNVDGSANVDIYASDISATNGVDYSFSPQTLYFSDKESNKWVFVQIVGNTLVQSNRTFALNLTNSVGAAIGEPASANVTIIDDDFVYPEVFLDDVEVVESAGAAHVQLRLSGTCPATASVDYATANGSAVAGVRGDYSASSGRITFSAGQTNKTLSVPIADNSLAGDNKFFYIILTNAHICTIARTNRTTVTIIDDDRLLKLEPQPGRTAGRLFWITNSAYELQSSLDLSNWSGVPMPSNVLGRYFCLSNSMFEPQRFYRLMPK